MNLIKVYEDRIIVFVTHDSKIISAVDEVIDITKNNP